METLLTGHCHEFSRIYRKWWTSVWLYRKRKVPGAPPAQWACDGRVDGYVCKLLLFLWQEAKVMWLPGIVPRYSVMLIHIGIHLKMKGPKQKTFRARCFIKNVSSSMGTILDPLKWANNLLSPTMQVESAGIFIYSLLRLAACYSKYLTY